MADPTAGAAESVGDRLLASSARFARSAATAYSDEEWDVFSLHLATKVGTTGQGPFWHERTPPSSPTCDPTRGTGSTHCFTCVVSATGQGRPTSSPPYGQSAPRRLLSGSGFSWMTTSLQARWLGCSCGLGTGSFTLAIQRRRRARQSSAMLPGTSRSCCRRKGSTRRSTGETQPTWWPSTLSAASKPARRDTDDDFRPPRTSTPASCRGWMSKVWPPT